jgi:hypothetical protein
MHAVPLTGRDVQVTINKTIEFDVEIHTAGNEGVPATPSRMRDEENGSDSPASELTNEEQYILRTLELQMKRDLEI